MNGKFLTPEDFGVIMGSSSFPESQDALMAQLQFAEHMRGSGAPEMRQAGRVAVAANPLEHIAAMMKDQRANRMGRETLAQQKALIEELRKAREAYGRNVLSSDIMTTSNPAGSNRTEIP